MLNHRSTHGVFTRAAGLLAIALAGFSGAVMADADVAAAASSRQAVSYSYQTLDYPGSSLTIFWGINDFGELAGQYSINGGTSHAMAYRRGHFEPLDPSLMGTYFSAAGGPTDSGSTFGGYTDAAGRQHGFIIRGDHTANVDFPGHLNANVDGLNEYGAIAAVYWDADGIFHGILRRGFGWDTPIDVAGARDTYPLGINGSGEIVGFWDNDPAVTHGFYRSANGKVSNVDVPGAASSVAFGITDNGVIAGYYTESTGAIHGFVETKGKFQTLDVPGAAATIATAINNFGVIAGEYFDTAGKRHGFVATPKLSNHRN
jgi:hypothetical protein